MRIEDNELLAEFIGFDVLSNGNYQYEAELTRTLPEFNSDWNWLMKLVEKINTFDKGIFGVTITGNKTTVEDCWGINENCCFECNDFDTLKNTYTTCIEFVKWYNNQNKP